MKTVKVINTRSVFLFIILLMAQIYVRAQDPIFSQPFLAPIYLNPAATGTGNHNLRVSAMYHRHWWSVPSGMNYMQVSVDGFIPKIYSGWGLMATHSREGYLERNGAYFSSSYNICSARGSLYGDPPKWFWMGGLQGGMAQTKVDYNRLVFPDQLSVNGVLPVASAADFPRNSGRFYPDLSAGMFFNYNFTSNTRLLAGFSGHHLNMPDESLTGSSDAFRSPLPVRWTGNLLFTHTNEEETWSYSISAVGYCQADNSNFQFGAEVIQNELEASLGVYYRSNYNFKYMSGNINSITVALSLNIFGRSNKEEKMQIGLAHDFQVGNNGYSYTSGSSELGVVWERKTKNESENNICDPKINTQGCPTNVH